mgnify:CR=1 FL=1
MSAWRQAGISTHANLIVGFPGATEDDFRQTLEAVEEVGFDSAFTFVFSPRQGTEAGMIMGTAAYMSPEQARGKTVDKRADIWAFGVVLYEMLTGTRLFKGETPQATIDLVLERGTRALLVTRFAARRNRHRSGERRSAHEASNGVPRAPRVQGFARPSASRMTRSIRRSGTSQMSATAT